jgi:hypothetical protein
MYCCGMQCCVQKASHTRVTTNLRLTLHDYYFPSGWPVRQVASLPHVNTSCLICLVGYLADCKVVFLRYNVSTELAIGYCPEPSQIHTFEADFHIILILFSSNVSPGGSYSFLLLQYCTSNLYCPSRGILLFYILHFITTAIIGTKENSDAIYFLDSPLIHPSQFHTYCWAHRSLICTVHMLKIMWNYFTHIIWRMILNF